MYPHQNFTRIPELCSNRPESTCSKNYSRKTANSPAEYLPSTLQNSWNLRDRCRRPNLLYTDPHPYSICKLRAIPAAVFKQHAAFPRRPATLAPRRRGSGRCCMYARVCGSALAAFVECAPGAPSTILTKASPSSSMVPAPLPGVSVPGGRCCHGSLKCVYTRTLAKFLHSDSREPTN